MIQRDLYQRSGRLYAEIYWYANSVPSIKYQETTHIWDMNSSSYSFYSFIEFMNIRKHRFLLKAYSTDISELKLLERSMRYEP